MMMKRLSRLNWCKKVDFKYENARDSRLENSRNQSRVTLFSNSRKRCRYFSNTIHSQHDWHKAIVESIAEFGSARRIIFRSESINGNSFSFQSGQWVDLHVPVGLGEKELPLGGYSIASPGASCSFDGKLAHLLPTSPFLPRFELGIKKAFKHLTTNHLHSTLKVGDSVHVKVGGTAFSIPLQSIINRLETENVKSEHVIFIAGGVGITPLYSMMLSIFSKKLEKPELQVKVSLIYSAQSEQDFLFINEIKTLQKHSGIDLSLYLLVATSRDENNSTLLHSWKNQSPHINQGQINQERFEKIISASNSSSSSSSQITSVFVCGPPSLIDDVVTFADTINNKSLSVFHEKW